MLDIYFYEGEKTLFRAGLAVLKMKEKQLLEFDCFEDIMIYLKENI